MSKDQNNVLTGVRIGSTLEFSEKRITFMPTIIEGKITTMTHESKSFKRFIGNSNYVYSDEMSEFKFGASIAARSPTVSAKIAGGFYTGSSSAQSSNDIEAHFRAYQQLGVERIDFDSLNIINLTASLKQNPKDALVNSLDAFLAIDQKLADERKTMAEAISDREFYQKYIQPLVLKWIAACNTFQTFAGDAFVTQIAWGAIGGIDFKISDSKGSSASNFGWNAEVTVASVAVAGSLGVNYDSSESRKDTNLKINLEQYLLGNALAEPINTWYESLRAVVQAKLLEVKPINSLPSLTKGVPIPPVPEFKKNHSEKILEKLNKLKGVDGDLEAFAKASAYEKKYQEKLNAITDPKKREKFKYSYKDFLAETKEPVNRDAINRAEEIADGNDTDIEQGGETGGEHTEPQLTHAALVSSPMAPSSEGIDFVPLGVSVCKWTDVFPWLATGQLNDMSSQSVAGKGLIDELKVQVLLQDLKTLGNLYLFGEEQGFQLSDGSKCRMIGDDFVGRRSELVEALKNPDTPRAAIIKNTKDKLNNITRKIYDVWIAKPVFRQAALGFGLVYSKAKEKTQVCQSVQWKLCRFGKWNLIPIQYNFVASPVNPDSKNYSAFTQSVKVYPIIDTDTDNSVRMFTAIPMAKETQQQISADNPDKFQRPAFSLIGKVGCVEADHTVVQHEQVVRLSDSMKFEFPTESAQEAPKFPLESGNYCLVPIPTSAARNLNWRGTTFYTSLSHFSDLRARLNTLKNDLSQVKAWSFSSDRWAGMNWSKNTGFSTKRMQKYFYYLGLIDKPGSM